MNNLPTLMVYIGSYLMSIACIAYAKIPPYIARKAFKDKSMPLSLVRDLTDNIHIASVDEGTVKNAIALEWSEVIYSQLKCRISDNPLTS